jgi:hypothetical protein
MTKKSISALALIAILAAAYLIYLDTGCGALTGIMTLHGKVCVN